MCLIPTWSHSSKMAGTRVCTVEQQSMPVSGCWAWPELFKLYHSDMYGGSLISITSFVLQLFKGKQAWGGLSTRWSVGPCICLTQIMEGG